MKLKSTLLAALLAVFAVSTATAFAADVVKAEKAEAAKTDSNGAKKPAKKVKKHSHAEEKTGMPMSEPAAGGTEKKDPKQTHDHTLDKH
jgi:hypothetical protein